MSDIPPTHKDDHYIRSLTRMGDRRPVLANRDIYSEDGVKLVAEGVRVDSRLHDKLIQHKLMSNLDAVLSVEGATDHAILVEDLHSLLTRQEPLGVMLEEEDLLVPLKRMLAKLPLVPAMAFKLTVARDQCPELFENSVLLCVVAGYLALKSEWAEARVVESMTAALLQNIGILHLDPALFAPGHVMSADERRQLYTHPLIAYLMLRSIPEYHPTISEAVLQHHERLDGSGYMRGLKGDEIGRIGRLLAVTEVVASRFDDRGPRQTCYDLDLVFKLNATKFDPGFVALLAPLFGMVRADNTPADSGLRQRYLSNLATMLDAWGAVAAERDSLAAHAFIGEQLGTLRKTLLGAGLIGGYADLLAELDRADPEYLGEIDTLIQEARWQMRRLLHEAVRRWPELIADSEGPADGVSAWLAKVGERISG